MAVSFVFLLIALACIIAALFYTNVVRIGFCLAALVLILCTLFTVLKK